MKGFHVIINEKKVGVLAQLKFHRALVMEGPPENAATYYKLAKQWNDEGRKMTTKAELAKLQSEVFAETPAYQGELFRTKRISRPDIGRTTRTK